MSLLAAILIPVLLSALIGLNLMSLLMIDRLQKVLSAANRAEKSALRTGRRGKVKEFLENWRAKKAAKEIDKQ